MKPKNKFDQIQIGDKASVTHTITAKDIADFVALTGDDNPLHVDTKYAAQTSFKRPVVHGMLTASFISTLIGTKLPGEGALWYEQSLKFLAPVRPGDTITVNGQVRHKSLTQRVIVMSIHVVLKNGKNVIEGEVKVKILDDAGEIPAVSSVLAVPKSAARTTARKIKKTGAVIITGGGKGIGAAIAQTLALDGFPVIVNYHTSSQSAARLVKTIQASGGEALAVKADVTDRDEVADMIKTALSEFKTFTGLVNCASAGIDDRLFTDLKWDDFQDHLNTQLKGAFNVTQEIIPYLLGQKSGIVVNIASTVTDHIPPARWIPYTVAKSGLIALTKSLASEYGKDNVRFNCVSPGMTMTDLIADVPEKSKILTKMNTPLRRLAEPVDIANTVSYLFSDKANFITGQNIRVCGGSVME
ncbi:MAG: SDR family oxidoreductase [Candidatus Omnitrophota bacterium]